MTKKPETPIVPETFTKELEEQTQRVEEYTNHLRRLQAEFENYMKRVDREKSDFSKYAHASLALKLLPIVDDFERAVQIMQKEADIKTIKEGISMIHLQLKKVLEEEGVKAIETHNQEVDPFKHEIIDVIPSDKPENIIVQEIQKGYMFKDKVLRISKVRVSKGAQKNV